MQNLLEENFFIRQRLALHRRSVYGGDLRQLNLETLQALVQAETNLVERQARFEQAAYEVQAGLLFSSALSSQRNQGLVLGAATSKINITVHLRLAHIPVAIAHLLQTETAPLISITFTNHPYGSGQPLRLAVVAYLEGCSDQAIATIEVPAGSSSMALNMLPAVAESLLPARSQPRPATLNILIEDVDRSAAIFRGTFRANLLPSTCLPSVILDPTEGKWLDMTPYLGAFVTPHQPEIIELARNAAGRCAPGGEVRFPASEQERETWMRAIYQELKESVRIDYSSQPLPMSVEEGLAESRLRLPRQALEEQQANSRDSALLFASLMEAAGLSPALVIAPGHFWVAWEAAFQSGGWNYLETSLVNSASFDEARAAGEMLAEAYRPLEAAGGAPVFFRRWPLRELRAGRGILPVE
jgi:hypothetical protein